MSDRFELHETVGWSVTTAATQGRWSDAKPGSSFSIIDTALCGREIWRDYSGRHQNHSVTRRRAKAVFACAAMNARERLWNEAA